MEEVPLESDEDYMRAIHLVIHGLDSKGTYRFRPTEEPAPAVVRKGAYTVPAGRIERTRKKG